MMKTACKDCGKQLTNKMKCWYIQPPIVEGFFVCNACYHKNHESEAEKIASKIEAIQKKLNRMPLATKLEAMQEIKSLQEQKRNLYL